MNFRKKRNQGVKRKNEKKKLFLETSITFLREEESKRSLTMKAKYFRKNLRVQAF